MNIGIWNGIGRVEAGEEVSVLVYGGDYDTYPRH
jgi:hypothetical protein